MSDSQKTKKQLIDELNYLRKELLKQQKSKDNNSINSELGLSDSNLLFQSFKFSPNPAIIIDKDRNIKFGNFAFNQRFDNHVKIINKKYTSLLADAKSEKTIEKEIKKVFSDGISLYNIHSAFKKNDTDKIDAKINLTPIFSNPGEITACKIEIILQDLLQSENVIQIDDDKSDSESAGRKLHDMNIPEHPFFFRTLNQTTPNAIRFIDTNGNHIFCNEQAVKLYGYDSIEDLLNRSPFDLIAEEDRKKAREIFRNTMKSKGKFSGLGIMFVKKDGAKFSGEASAATVINNKGKLLGLVAVTRDVSKQKADKEKILEQSKKFQTLFDFSPHGVMVEDFKGVILDVNPSFCKILEHDKEDLVGKKLESFLKNKKEIKLALKQAAGGKQPRIIAERIASNKSMTYIELQKVQIGLGEREDLILVTGIDLTDNKEYENEIMENEFRYRTLFNLSPSGIILEESDGTIIDINPAMCESLGYKPHELINHHISKIVPKEFHNQIKKNIKKILSGETLMQTVRNTGKHGEEIRLLLKEVRVPLPDGTNGILLVSNDITEQIRKEEELIKAKEKAENLNRMKSNFLAQMSHEIRSPLNVILSFTSLIKEELNNENFTDHFDAIDHGSKRIIRTIDLILNMAEIQTGSYEIIPSKFDLNEDIVKKLMLEYKSAAASKGLKLQHKCNLEAAPLFADEYSISQILSNLIDNAIKYTNQGKIEVVVYRDKVMDLCADVRDTGIGISEEYLPRLFDEFTQEETGYTRRFDGTGLGMSIVQKYCQANNADISVKSKKNAGTTFTVKFRSS